jgi:hypothetical protein
LYLAGAILCRRPASDFASGRATVRRADLWASPAAGRARLPSNGTDPIHAAGHSTPGSRELRPCCRLGRCRRITSSCGYAKLCITAIMPRPALCGVVGDALSCQPERSKPQLRIIGLQSVEEFKQVITLRSPPGGAWRRVQMAQRAPLHLHIGLNVLVCGLRALVTKPQGNDV